MITISVVLQRSTFSVLRNSIRYCHHPLADYCSYFPELPGDTTQRNLPYVHPSLSSTLEYLHGKYQTPGVFDREMEATVIDIHRCIINCKADSHFHCQVVGVSDQRCSLFPGCTARCDTAKGVGQEACAT